MSTYVLDTCILLWLLREPEKVSEQIDSIVRNPENRLLVSVISAWEIANKSKQGKLVLSKPIEEWWKTLLTTLRAQEVSLTSEILMASVTETLPHKDPADRMIVATARAAGARLLTADQTLLAHCDLAYW